MPLLPLRARSSPSTHQATPTGFIGFLALRVGMYSTPSGSPPLLGSGLACGPAGWWQFRPRSRVPRGAGCPQGLVGPAASSPVGERR